MDAKFPALVAISHGTSSTEGRAAVKGLRDALEAAIAARPGPAPTVRLGHVDVEQPDVPATLATLEPGESAVIVPLLLSAGYHVHVDLTEAADDATDRPVALAGALGPDDRLVEVLMNRALAAGLRDDDTVVLAVAGSSDARAVQDCYAVADAFARRLGRGIHIGFLSAAAPRLHDAVAGARAEKPEARIMAVSYLLAPGYFQGLIEKSGADVWTDPLLVAGGTVPPQLVEIVLDRYAAASTA